MVRLALILMLLAGQVLAQSCVGNDSDHHFAASSVTLQDGAPYSRSLPNGWTLEFKPHAHGWQVKLLDHNGLDLSQITPPRLGPNPRDLFGWHFRNADNSGPNTGDVNAPQHQRVLFFAPALAGTGGFKPADGAVLAPDAQSGVGTLALRDLVLSPPKAGGKARLMSARLDLCLRWPKAGLVEEQLELLARCGLDLSRWPPVNTLSPQLQQGDFDGDDAGDEAVLVRNPRSGQTALAICRAQTWLTLIPQDTPVLRADFLASVETWRTLPRDHGPLGYVDEPAWPAAAGDVIVLERVEKSIDLLFWQNGDWQVSRVYGVVTGEPD